MHDDAAYALDEQFGAQVMKGAGEGGTIASIAAIIGAVENALAPFGVRINEAPISPERIVALVNERRAGTG